MKLIFLLFFIFGVCTAIYLFITYLFLHFKELKKVNMTAFAVSAFIGLLLITLIAFAVHSGEKANDSWCTTSHVSNSYPPADLLTATDYFEKGNYEYDIGKCKEAIDSYAKSIELDSVYPQAYNNKAYTEMRMHDYKDALDDLNNALTIDPNYVSALMNRGDIHNYYFDINKNAAITDYKKIISLSGNRGSVCGHLFLAEHDGWNLVTILALPSMIIKCQGS